MSALEIIIGILMILVSLFITFVIVLQEGSRSGSAGVITGGADTFLSKNKSRAAGAKLARWTSYVAIAFFVLAIVANVIAFNA